jgi:type III restriction enzyme
VLESLRDFFRLTARAGDPGPAFAEISARSFGIPMPYVPVSVAGLQAGMPYVCLRVPTGGGKTLLACYAAGSGNARVHAGGARVVLWLVPSHYDSKPDCRRIARSRGIRTVARSRWRAALWRS